MSNLIPGIQPIKEKIQEPIQESKRWGHVCELDMTMKEMQIKIIKERLEYFRGDRSAAADSLGVPTKTLYNWFMKYNLFPEWSRKIW